MKPRIFLFSALLLPIVLFVFSGCAQKNPEYIPISLNWYEYQGDLQSVGEKAPSAAIDSSQEETCLISMTRALMESQSLRECSAGVQEYHVQYFGISTEGKTQAIFRGQSAVQTESIDMEKVPLSLSSGKNCNFTARCNTEGKIENLKIF